MVKNSRIEYQDLGLIPYRDAWRYQERLRGERLRGEVADTFIFCEHPPVLTLGRQDCASDLKLPVEDIISNGIDVVRTDRGGRATYHGPGQIVGYLVFDIKGRGFGVKDFVYAVEEVSRLALLDFGIESERDLDNPGLWVKGEKIVAIGLSISKNISMHGFALNYKPNMEHYKYIVPCGIKGRGVTSMKMILGARLPHVGNVKDALKKEVVRLF